MKKSAMIRARVEPKIKEEAEIIFKSLGLNASEAISLFYHQVSLKQGMPFAVNISRKHTISKVSNYTKDILVKHSKRMTPHERLNAFLNHSYLLQQIENEGKAKRTKRRSVLKHAR